MRSSKDVSDGRAAERLAALFPSAPEAAAASGPSAASGPLAASGSLPVAYGAGDLPDPDWARDPVFGVDPPEAGWGREPDVAEADWPDDEIGVGDPPEAPAPGYPGDQTSRGAGRIAEPGNQAADRSARRAAAVDRLAALDLLTGAAPSPPAEVADQTRERWSRRPADLPGELVVDQPDALLNDSPSLTDSASFTDPEPGIGGAPQRPHGSWPDRRAYVRPARFLPNQEPAAPFPGPWTEEPTDPFQPPWAREPLDLTRPAWADERGGILSVVRPAGPAEAGRPAWVDQVDPALRSAGAHRRDEPSESDRSLPEGGIGPQDGRSSRQRFPTAAAFDPGRPGLKVIAVVAAVVVVGAAGVAWFTRPHDDPVAPAPAISTDATFTQADAGAQVVVAVAGKVLRPGLVRLPAGSRVADALAAAGGALPGTDLSTVNLARKVVDGELITVGGPPAGGAGGAGGVPGKVSLNSATVAQLDALPGVGPVLAQRIVEYRDRKGGFGNVTELRQVDGIGDAKYAEIKDLVTL